MFYAQVGATDVDPEIWHRVCAEGERTMIERERQRTSEASRVLLLIEDSPQLLQAARRELERDGWRVIPAMTVADALEVLDEPPRELAVVVSDYQLPDGSGIQLLEIAGAKAGWCARLLVSGAHFSEDEAATLGRAFDAFLPKPLLPGQLAATVRRLVLSE